MTDIKLKYGSRYKVCGKGELLRKKTTGNCSGAIQPRVAYKDYVNEVFAGLIWLG